MKEFKVKLLKPLNILFFIFVFAVLFLVVVASIYYFHFNAGGGFSNNPSDWGTFGDYLGGVLNPLFGFLTLIALLITIILQKQELDNTKMELNTTIKDAEKKRIETTIFQMFNFLSELCDKVTCHSANSIDVESKLYTGKKAFSELYYVLSAHNTKEVALVLQQGHSIDEDRIFRQALENFWHSDGRNILHYFQFIKQFLKRIDDNNLIDQPFYINLLKSQLSNDELCLFVYYCLWFNDKELIALVDKWEFFIAVQPNSLIKKVHQAEFRGAFGCPF
ncbi:MAG: hypothetical protein JEZ12_24805 [Desulfobacterium sp.]|nr:hypothetical protein [Desulfobacterium sp.]